MTSLVLLFLLSAQIVSAQVVDPQNVLIQNVHLIEAGDDAGEVLVNILIRDNKLEIVTKDPISIDEAISAVDANNGYLLGQLVVGETPSIIILSQDPRANFNVLLNTSPYTLFAVHDGQLFRNILFAATEQGVKAQPTGSGWTAYAPPPMALPLSYQDTAKWNRWETKYLSGIFLAAAVLDNQRWLDQDEPSRQQVGDLGTFDGGEVRGFRIGAVGTLNFERPLVYTIFGATNAFDKGYEIRELDSFAFFDYRLDIPVSDKMNLSIGKQKEPISMERIMSMVQLPMQERTSVSDAFLPSRNFGAVLSGTALNDRMTWAGGAFNDWLDTSGSFSDNANEFMGRVTWLPFVSEDDGNLVHLGFGARYSTAKDGLRYRTEPEFNKSSDFVDTGKDRIAADNAMQYNLEASWRRGPYWLAGEYVSTDVDAPALGNPYFRGYHITGSWILTGEMRSYRKTIGIFGPVPVARSVYQGGWGAWEIAVRWSDLDLTDGAIDGGEMGILSLGLNWWLSPVFNVNFNYRHITLDRFGIEGTSSGFMGRVLLMLE